MSEYGGSPREIAQGWTPAQALVMAERIRRRRAREQAEATELQFVAAAAAFGGKPAFAQLRRITAALRREARGKGGAPGLSALAQSMGLPRRGDE